MKRNQIAPLSAKAGDGSPYAHAVSLAGMVGLRAGLISLTLALSALTACSNLSDKETPSDPFPSLVFDPQEVARAEALVVAIPGALTSYTIFRPLEARLTSSTAIVYFRLPGMDGRPLDTRVKIAEASDEIARLAGANPNARVTLVGHSTGAAIALEAAIKIGARAQVAAISAPAPGEAEKAGLRGLIETLRIAARLGTLERRRVWEAYYKVLLFGRDYRAAPTTQERADQTVARTRERITQPSAALFRAHSGDLRGWALSDAQTLGKNHIVFFHGDVDPVFPIKRLASFARSIPNAKVIRLEGQGHLLYLTERNLFESIGASMGAW